MTETIAHIRQALKGFYPDSETAALARLILEHVSRMPFHRLLLGKDKDLSSSQKRRIEEIVSGLRERQPIQYLLGEETFLGLTLKVTPDVLIPRPETGDLVRLVHQELTGQAPRVLDIGTGSGCVALALAHLLPQAHLTAIDISEAALRVAQENAARLQVRVHFERVDILAPEALQALLPLGPFDAIVSNPPYVREQERKEMDANVVDHEPAIALFVPDDDPLRFYRAIARIGRSLLKPGGALYFEINSHLGAETRALLIQENYTGIRLLHDQFGLERILTARKDI